MDLPTLIEKLKDWADVQQSEDFSGTTLGGYITDAIKLHNSSYTLETLPDLEVEPVLTLAWAKLTFVRASKWARQNNTGGQVGFSQNRDTPYYKLTLFADKLKQRYAELCADLGIPDAKSSIKVSNLKVMDTRLDALTPIFATDNLPIVTLTVDDNDEDGELIVSWPRTWFSDFRCVYLFVYQNPPSGQTIFQNWNYASKTGVPRINESASLIKTFYDPNDFCVKVTDLDKTNPIRFLLALSSRSVQFGYSNEFVFTPAQ